MFIPFILLLESAPNTNTTRKNDNFLGSLKICIHIASGLKQVLSMFFKLCVNFNLRINRSNSYKKVFNNV